jgi:demethylmenaquinone methyltransferase / 2-methoxy-6-polyprenyl-1,4-benzoquinol methylase
MFDRIAARYDLLNRLLSARRDVAWRTRLVQLLPQTADLMVLDLATGTGDVLVALHSRGAKPRASLGLDLSAGMLALARDKLRAHGIEKTARLARADALRIPASEAAFDAATIAFGIRNVLDVKAALAEIHRVLRPGGPLLVLEFSLPAKWWFKPIYLWYLRHVLPRMGRLVSGDPGAYRYLNHTIETFPYGETFCTLMKEAGFINVEAFPLTMGIATIYKGERPA